MAIKSYNPTTPSRRFITDVSRDHLSKERPVKTLVKKLNKYAGRNCHGHISMRHRGGGSKKLYRIIDFKRDKDGIPGTVARIEYDPYRSANVALINYADGEKRYILAPEGLEEGTKILSGDKCEFNVGNCMPLTKIPLGTQLHNIELVPGNGGTLVRSAGCSAVLMAREGKYAHIRMPSGEVRLVPVISRATIGTVGNREHKNISLNDATMSL